MRPKDVVRALDQQTSEISVAGLGGPELRIAFAGLTASGSQTEVATYVSTSTKAFLVTKRQDEREGRDVTNAVNGQQRLRLGLLRLSHPLDLPIVLLDLQRHRRDLFEHRTECNLKSWRHRGLATLSENTS